MNNKQNHKRETTPASIESVNLPISLKNPVMFDRSHWGRVRLTGADRVRFLHNQTTQNIEQLSAGEGAHTVFVTSTGRTIDLTTVFVDEASLLVITSPGMAQSLYDWMDRYIFFSDKVTLADESDQTFMFTVLGEGCDEVMIQIGAKALVDQPKFSHQRVAVAGTQITAAVGGDLAVDGYTLWGRRDDAKDIWQTLTAAGATVGSTQQWENLRIRQGRPMPHQELTEDDNPLESGLWHSVSFEKGCYIGQETIARLNTYKGVKKRLWGLVLAHPANEPANEPASNPANELANIGETVWLGDDKIGKVTSLTKDDSGMFGLAYLRTKAGGKGLQVMVGDRDQNKHQTKADVVELPFVNHEYYSTDVASP